MNATFEPTSDVTPPSCEEPLLKSARLDELLVLLGRPRFHKLLELLIVDCRDRPGRIGTCHARGDLVGLGAEAAMLARAARDIGATTLGNAASSLSSSADVAAALPLMEALREAAQATLEVARQLFEHRPAVQAER